MAAFIFTPIVFLRGSKYLPTSSSSSLAATHSGFAVGVLTQKFIKKKSNLAPTRIFVLNASQYSFTGSEDSKPVDATNSSSHENKETSWGAHIRRQLLRLVIVVFGVLVAFIYHSVVTQPAFWVTLQQRFPFGNGQFSIIKTLTVVAFYILLEPLLVLTWRVRLRMGFASRKVRFEDSATVTLLYGPLRLLGWLFSALIIFDLIFTVDCSRIGVLFPFSALVMRRAAIITYCAIMLNYLKNIYIIYFVKDRDQLRAERGDLNLVDKGLSLILLLTTIVSYGFISGVPLDILTKLGGFSGLAVAFACREALKDLYAGVMLYTFKPFVEFDWILIPGLDSKGRLEVEKIGWMYTLCRMWDTTEILIPNSHLFGGKVINCSLRTSGYFSERVHIRYTDLWRVDELMDKMEQALAQHPDVDTSQQLPMVLNEKLTNQGIVIHFTAWLLARSQREIMVASSKLTLFLARIVADSGFEFSFPRVLVEEAEKFNLGEGMNSKQGTTTKQIRMFPLDGTE